MVDLDDPQDRALRLAAEVVDALAANRVLQARLAHATWHVESLRESLTGAQSRLVEYREALEDSQAALGKTQVLLGQAQQELGRIQRELHLVLTSPSWRVTSPLRGAKRLVRGTR